MEFLTFIGPHVASHPYLYLFLGMVIGGETFFLPAVYLASQGVLHFSAVLAISALATLISDTAWYVIGRSFPLSRILSWKKFSARRDAYIKIFQVFKTHSKKLLFISKFVYGTRTMVQILSGSVKMSFLNYSFVNLAGITSYLLAVSLLAFITKHGLASLEYLSYNKYVSVGVFIILIAIFHLCLKKLLSKKFSASSSPLGTKNEL
jgi:membrane protein DedA with SNARE-associated domain